MSAAHQVGFDASFQNDQAVFFQPGGFGLTRRGHRQPGQRRAPPQRERFPHRFHSRGDIPRGKTPLAVGGESFELEQVQLPWLEPHQIPPRPCHYPRRGIRATGPPQRRA